MSDVGGTQGPGNGHRAGRHSNGGPLLAPQRQSAILEQVRARGGVRVTELVREFGVSDMTIRRDLATLAERRLLATVHGGATAIRPHTTDETGFATNLTRQHAEKEAIADHAARLVKPGTAVVISAGTTTWAFAQRLVDVEELTVVTNSVPV